MLVRGATSQSADLQAWQSNAGVTTLASISSSGSFFTNSTLFTTLQTYIYGASDYGAALNVQTRATGSQGVIVRGRASQTANLQEWQASDGGTAARVTSSGSLVTTQGFAVLGGASISGSIATLLQTSNAARIALVVQGAASQSANLQEWQNSAGGTVARVNNLGEFFAPIIWTTNAYAGFTEQSAGGALRMTKLTAAGSNPGAGNGRIYFRDGTNAGTLKLVVRAGAAGAETTILDNIPQS